MAPQRRRAFTLVELLVVIGIVAVLIALLMPALSGAKKKAQAVQCAANLRSIGQAMTMYVQQYGYYPAGGGLRPPRPNAPAIWPTRLRALLGRSRGPFHCPSRDERFVWEDGAAVRADGLRADETWTHFGYEMGEGLLESETTYFSYGYNDKGTGWESGLGYFVYVVAPPPGMAKAVMSGEVRASLVRFPSDMMAVADSNADGWSDYTISPGLALVHPGGVHNGGTNALFCDGHVNWHLRSELLFDGTGNPGSMARRYRMWNRSGEPE